MPKMKTRRSAAKRYRVTGAGKVLRRPGNRSHIRRKKSSRRLRRLDGLVEVPKGQRRAVNRHLGR